MGKKRTDPGISGLLAGLRSNRNIMTIGIYYIIPEFPCIF
jgi:hypothetical protein